MAWLYDQGDARKFGVELLVGAGAAVSGVGAGLQRLPVERGAGRAGSRRPRARTRRPARRAPGSSPVGPMRSSPMRRCCARNWADEHHRLGVARLQQLDDALEVVGAHGLRGIRRRPWRGEVLVELGDQHARLRARVAALARLRGRGRRSASARCACSGSAGSAAYRRRRRRPRCAGPLPGPRAGMVARNWRRRLSAGRGEVVVHRRGEGAGLERLAR